MSPLEVRSILLSSTDFDLPEVKPGLARYVSFREMSRSNSALLRSCVDTVTGRTVAVKTLLPEAAKDIRESRRLLREARVTAQLQHPNTVPVYDIGRDEREGLFFTMKRISGENFFEVLKRIAMKDQVTIDDFPLRRRVEVAMDAAQALAYAHARGVIHRDVKPENIWVGNFGEVILLDWGVAKVWGQPDERHHPKLALEKRPQSLTLTGQRPGTPLYMSPEQVGDRLIDERTDVFSMGVVLYELLALREPFRGHRIEETFENILHKNPPPPSEQAPEREIPAALDEIVMKAIAKNPAARYQRMTALVSAVNQALSAPPT
jgi:serine/threonine-protein kinase